MSNHRSTSPESSTTPPRAVAVIVHHRGRAMLQRAIVSLLESRRVELEVVVVSNRCLEPLPEVVETSGRVHVVVSEESLGFSAANNLGVSWAVQHLAPAGWYYFVNNDTQSTAGALAELIAALEARPDAAVAGPRLLILGAPTHLNSLGINVTVDGWGWDEGIGLKQLDYGVLPPTREVLAVTGSALLMRADVFERVGRWTEVYDYYFEDIDLCVKSWKAGHGVLQVPAAVVMHRISASMGVVSERKLFLFWRNRLFLALVHWPVALVMALGWRALVEEILLRRRRHSALQRRALRATLAHLGKLLRCRHQLRGSYGWRRFLAPAGSVPVITLPEVAPLDEPLSLVAYRVGPEKDDRQNESEESVSSSQETIGKTKAGELVGRPGDDGDVGGPALFRRASAWVPASSEGRRLLVLGWSPLPFESARMNYAPGIRSWQLASALAADGHAVCLALARIPGTEDAEAPEIEVEEHGGVLIAWLERERFENAGDLERLADDFRPEAVVAAAIQPARRAVEIAGELPLWIDVFGDPMAEAQAKAVIETEGHHLSPYLRLLATLLARGDAFSAVSERQRWALVGQLGLVGRLSRATAGAEMVHAMAVSCESWTAESPPSDTAVEGEEPPLIDGWLPSAGDFVVLWSGGYNTWCDVETLFAALERALAARESLCFVSTGGVIEGHDESTYDLFLRKVEGSAHRERYHLAGRLPTAAAAAWQRRADLAVVTERPLAERQLGSSGRVQRWLVEGVPLLCAELSELGELVARQGLGRTYGVGDGDDLAQQILEAVDDPAEGRRRAEVGRVWAAEHLSTASTTEPLRSWAKETRPAADRSRSGEGVSASGLELRCLLAEARDDLGAVEQELDASQRAYHALRSELGRIHQSRMWKTWMALTAPLATLRRLLGRGG